MDRERGELATDRENEHAELAAIYVARGLDAGLANQVATQLMAKDALGAHARDELGISETLTARPVQAAFASAGSFTLGAVLPLLLVLIVPRAALVWTVSCGSLLLLALLGATAVRGSRSHGSRGKRPPSQLSFGVQSMLQVAVFWRRGRCSNFMARCR